jgi:hypothetical protein
MSDALKITLTAVAGVTVFVFGQIIQKWFVEPIQEQRKLVGDIVYSIIFHSNLFKYTDYFRVASKIKQQVDKLKTTDAELLNEAYDLLKDRSTEGTEQLRKLSSQIHRSIQVIPCYWILEKLRIVYSRDTLYDVANKLIQWAANPELETTVESQNDIIYLLNVRHLIKGAQKTSDNN